MYIYICRYNGIFGKQDHLINNKKGIIQIHMGYILDATSMKNYKIKQNSGGWSQGNVNGQPSNNSALHREL